jgi:outer membrane lipoprotein-sorting protein
MVRRRAAFLAALLAGTMMATAGLAQTVTGSVPVPVPSPKKATQPQPSVAQAPKTTAPTPAPGVNASAVGTGSATAPMPVGRPPAPVGKPGETTAFDDKQRELVNRVSDYLSNIRTLVGDFVQVGPDGSRTEGQLYLQKPGRVRFEYNPPSPIELIADGQSVVVRDRKLATQDLYPLSQTPLRFLLADRVDLLRDTNVVAVYSDDVFSTIVIEEKQALGGTHRLMLMFASTDLTLRQWTVTDPQGFDTTVAVYNLDTARRPDPSLFKINYERVLQ